MVSNPSSLLPQTMQTQLTNSLSLWQQHITTAMLRFLPSQDMAPCALHQAMHYACLNGGKRLRPALVYATGASLGATRDDLDFPACAVEFVHAYSLIHDDLPAMDDADLRRGKPTCHKAFDEATAILAGDALQALAFHVLQTQGQKITAELSQAALAMVDGQALDLLATGTTMTQEALDTLHAGKTGALITASVLSGALAAGVEDATTLDALRQFSQCAGLAFQIQDDILDVTASTEQLGKPQGKDAELNKQTYPALMGLEGAQKRARDLIEKSIRHLDTINLNDSILADLAWYMIERDS